MKTILSLALLSALVGSSEAGGVTSRLQVHIPKTLTRDKGYDHREALFGVPPYGGSIQQTVYYADQDLCDSNVDTTKGFPERKDGGHWPSPYILMVDRGDCTFVRKVRNAQRSGAAGVIIADNKCLCSAGDKCKPDDAEEVCEMKEPIMADDGSGSDISIPSFLMFKEDADPIREVLKQNKMVRMEMTWAIPKEDNRVEYDLFTTPTDSISRPFQDQFKAAALALGKHAKFTPHMYIYDGIKAGCQGFDGENQCYNLCTNNGRYCATDPDDDLDSGISGADVVTESLRRACIWKIYGADGVGEKWWTYVEEFMYRCQEEDYFMSDDCINDVYVHAGVVKGDVDACMLDSGGLEGDESNSVLEAQLGEREASGVVIIPSMYVDTAAIRGALEFSTVFKAVCAGYTSNTEPEVCKKCANCLDEYGCVVQGKCTAGGVSGIKSGVTPEAFAGTLGVMVFIFCIAGFIQWRRTQSQMRNQVRGIMAEYMPLDKRQAMGDHDTSVGLSEGDGEFS
ncbi:Vacuolar-sorting receptor 1 [Seminavis robusta]|uniref:Vacuolar-sorting receptor 1 n=1 Tax=Seminavis robusta TaxID=568900 RepID=A0A9N8F149_9STRA|nr:Vacuolar-sorting receptor 1 [Seminavis robusta]|eukprot:Sro3123_g344250.1 Vacuolar-sorting receptor 1 (510) ;mRNA; f:4675-6473